MNFQYANIYSEYHSFQLVEASTCSFLSELRPALFSAFSLCSLCISSAILSVLLIVFDFYIGFLV